PAPLLLGPVERHRLRERGELLGDLSVHRGRLVRALPTHLLQLLQQPPLRLVHAALVVAGGLLLRDAGLVEAGTVGGLVAQARSHVYAPSSRACACTCVRVRVHSHVGASPRAAPGGATLIRHRCRPPPRGTTRRTRRRPQRPPGRRTGTPTPGRSAPAARQRRTRPRPGPRSPPASAPPRGSPRSSRQSPHFATSRWAPRMCRTSSSAAGFPMPRAWRSFSAGMWRP